MAHEAAELLRDGDGYDDDDGGDGDGYDDDGSIHDRGDDIMNENTAQYEDRGHTNDADHGNVGWNARPTNTINTINNLLPSSNELAKKLHFSEGQWHAQTSSWNSSWGRRESGLENSGYDDDDLSNDDVDDDVDVREKGGDMKERKSVHGGGDVRAVHGGGDVHGDVRGDVLGGGGDVRGDGDWNTSPTDLNQCDGVDDIHLYNGETKNHNTLPPHHHHHHHHRHHKSNENNISQQRASSLDETTLDPTHNPSKHHHNHHHHHHHHHILCS